MIKLNYKKCGVCNAHNAYFLFEEIIGEDESLTNILLCKNCSVLRNIQGSDDVQKGFFEIYFSTTDGDFEYLKKTIDELIIMIDYFYPKYSTLSTTVNNKTFLDVGCGQGLLSIAALKYGFDKVISVDINTETMKDVINILKANDYIESVNLSNLHIYDSMQSVTKKCDCVFMWHVLEHIENPLDFLLNYVIPILNKEAVLFIQIPLYRKKYVERVHHYFFNKPSVSFLMESCGLIIIDFIYDHTNEFLTIISKYE